MARTILIMFEGKKEAKAVIPDDSKLTFGPWSPGVQDKYSNSAKALAGTLRIYRGKTDTSGVIGVFSGVTGYRDLSLIDYSEKTAIETGSSVWKSDKRGYERKESIQYEEEWDKPLLSAGEVDANAGNVNEVNEEVYDKWLEDNEEEGEPSA